MATNKPQDDYKKTALRLPPELHERLHEAAAASGRSYNAEIVARLQSSFPDSLIASHNPASLESTESRAELRELLEAIRAEVLKLSAIQSAPSTK